MPQTREVQYEAKDYVNAAEVCSQLATTHQDLSLSERNSLLRAAAVLRSWAIYVQRKS